MQEDSKNKSSSFSNSTNVKTYDSAAAVIRFRGASNSNSVVTSSSEEDDYEKIPPVAPGKNPPAAEESNVRVQNGKQALNAQKGTEQNKQESRYQSGRIMDVPTLSVNESPEFEFVEHASPSSMSQCTQRRFNPFTKFPYMDDGHFGDYNTIKPLTKTNISDIGHLIKAQLDVKTSALDDMLSDCSDTNSNFSLDDTDFADITDEDLGLSEDHFSRPEMVGDFELVPDEGFFGYSKVEELELAIENCKEMVRKSDEHSEQRRTLVNKLIQLRMKLLEVKFPEEDNPDIKLIVGHRFRRKHGKGVNHQCERCNSLIWRMLQSWYRCLDCGLNCHSKCLNLIKRECVSRKLSGANYSTEICPEVGLSAQNYRCAECKTPISFKDASDIRQCDYSGKFFCTECHWNDTEVIPARVLHNWDFEPRKVCRQSKQFLQLMMKRAVLKVDAVNERLFNYVEELSQIRKLREEILIMKSYFLSCRNALEGQLLLQLKERRHFVESSDMYSLKDLIDMEQNSLLHQLEKIHSNYVVHIKLDCQLCQGKGYICEVCGEDDVIFPFDIIASRCKQCSAVFHRDCFYKRGNECPKCLRLSKRQTVIGLQSSTSPT